MEINYGDIGKRVRRERENKNITQEQLAEMVDCSTAHISHIETGNTIPSLKLIIDIINKLNISSDLILCDYLDQADYVYKNEINDLFEDCTETEIRFLVDLAKENLKVFRKYSEKRQ